MIVFLFIPVGTKPVFRVKHGVTVDGYREITRAMSINGITKRLVF